MSRFERHIRILVAAFATLSLLLVGFAHTVPAQPLEPDLAAYTLPDGSIPVICMTGSGEEPAGNAGFGRCEFCRISSAIALPEPPVDFTSCAAEPVFVFDLPHVDIPPREVFADNAPARGPPAGSHNS